MSNRPRAVIYEGREIPPSDIHLILLYPGSYERVVSNGQEIYQERNRHDRGHDKHFWVDAAEVDAWRNWPNEN